MAGWQVYAPNWGCDNWDLEYDGFYYDQQDWLNFNLVIIDVNNPHYYTTHLFIRQPEDKDSIAARLRMQNCANLIKRQWLQSLYNPQRQICQRRLLQDFCKLTQSDGEVWPPT